MIKYYFQVYSVIKGHLTPEPQYLENELIHIFYNVVKLTFQSYLFTFNYAYPILLGIRINPPDS